MRASAFTPRHRADLRERAACRPRTTTTPSSTPWVTVSVPRFESAANIWSRLAPPSSSSGPRMPALRCFASASCTSATKRSTSAVQRAGLHLDARPRRRRRRLRVAHHLGGDGELLAATSGARSRRCTSRPIGSSSPSTESSMPVGETSRVRARSDLPVGARTCDGDARRRAIGARAVGALVGIARPRSAPCVSKPRALGARVVEIERVVVEIDLADSSSSADPRRHRLRRRADDCERSAFSRSGSRRSRSSGRRIEELHRDDRRPRSARPRPSARASRPRTAPRAATSTISRSSNVVASLAIIAPPRARLRAYSATNAFGSSKARCNRRAVRHCGSGIVRSGRTWVLRRAYRRAGCAALTATSE